MAIRLTNQVPYIPRGSHDCHRDRNAQQEDRRPAVLPVPEFRWPLHRREQVLHSGLAPRQDPEELTYTGKAEDGCRQLPALRAGGRRRHHAPRRSRRRRLQALTHSHDEP